MIPVGLQFLSFSARIFTEDENEKKILFLLVFTFSVSGFCDTITGIIKTIDNKPIADAKISVFAIPQTGDVPVKISENLKRWEEKSLVLMALRQVITKWLSRKKASVIMSSEEFRLTRQNMELSTTKLF